LLRFALFALFALFAYTSHDCEASVHIRLRPLASFTLAL
jgi:hypothetical protein